MKKIIYILLLLLVSSLVAHQSYAIENKSCAEALGLGEELRNFYAAREALLRVPSFDNSDRVVFIYKDLFNKSNTISNTNLHNAAAAGDTSLINFFVTDKGMPVDVKGRLGMTPLSVAATFFYINAIDVLLNLNADINAPGATGNSPLISAVISGQIQAVEYLLEKGANIDQANIADETPIMFAVKYGFPGIFRLLASRGANLMVTNIQGWTLLHVAINERRLIDRVGMVETILDTVVDWPEPGIVNWPEPISEGSPLHWAVWHGRADVIDVLLERGARLDAKNKDGELPIHIAARLDNVDAFLLLKNTDLNLLGIFDGKGQTPINTVDRHNSLKILSALALALGL